MGQVMSLVLSLDLWLPRTVISVLGKGFSEASFTCVFLYTTELYPTVLRSVVYHLQIYLCLNIKWKIEKGLVNILSLLTLGRMDWAIAHLLVVLAFLLHLL